jgi:TonB family protein
LKDNAATDKYGEKAKDGAIEITTKKYDSLLKSEISDVKINGNSKEETYIVVEEMPSFPGGEKAIQSWIYSNIKVMKGAEKISGPVNVIFTVDSKGKVRDAKVKKPEFPVWEAEAIRVVSSMPDWIPGSQNGKPIDVIMQLPIDFSMKVARQIK